MYHHNPRALCVLTRQLQPQGCALFPGQLFGTVLRHVGIYRPAYPYAILSGLVFALSASKVSTSKNSTNCSRVCLCM
ncbi:hypothetical protein AHF37_08230 [Paragonimus kellicotti]|nr:hypothetical protein AHF37_08230 [Paragonimus kellicotti]